MNKQPTGWRSILSLIAIGAVIVTTLFLRYHQSKFGFGEVTIGEDVMVKVEVAANDATKERGLSGRESLESGRGMLFVFDQPDRYVFWMKQMKFPIDAIWFKDGQIVDLAVNLQPPQPGENAQVFSPISAVDAVLEVPAGFVAAHGLKLGLPVAYHIDR